MSGRQSIMVPSNLPGLGIWKIPGCKDQPGQQKRSEMKSQGGAGGPRSVPRRSRMICAQDGVNGSGNATRLSRVRGQNVYLDSTASISSHHMEGNTLQKTPEKTSWACKVSKHQRKSRSLGNGSFNGDGLSLSLEGESLQLGFRDIKNKRDSARKSLAIDGSENSTHDKTIMDRMAHNKNPSWKLARVSKSLRTFEDSRADSGISSDISFPTSTAGPSESELFFQYPMLPNTPITDKEHPNSSFSTSSLSATSPVVKHLARKTKEMKTPPPLTVTKGELDDDNLFDFDDIIVAETHEEIAEKDSRKIYVISGKDCYVERQCLTQNNAEGFPFESENIEVNESQHEMVEKESRETSRVSSGKYCYRERQLLKENNSEAKDFEEKRHASRPVKDRSHLFLASSYCKQI